MKPLVFVWYALLLLANAAPFVMHFLQDMGLLAHHLHFTASFMDTVSCLTAASIVLKVLDSVSNAFRHTKDWLLYLTGSSRLSVKEKENQYLELFDAIDVNGDGVVNKDELVRVFNRLFQFALSRGQTPDRESFDEIWMDMDTNRDGFVTKEEFVEAQFRREMCLGDRISL